METGQTGVGKDSWGSPWLSSLLRERVWRHFRLYLCICVSISALYWPEHLCGAGAAAREPSQPLVSRCCLPRTSWEWGLQTPALMRPSPGRGDKHAPKKVASGGDGAHPQAALKGAGEVTPDPAKPGWGGGVRAGARPWGASLPSAGEGRRGPAGEFGRYSPPAGEPRESGGWGLGAAGGGSRPGTEAGRAVGAAGLHRGFGPRSAPGQVGQGHLPTRPQLPPCPWLGGKEDGGPPLDAGPEHLREAYVGCGLGEVRVSFEMGRDVHLIPKGQCGAGDPGRSPGWTRKMEGTPGSG